VKLVAVATGDTLTEVEHFKQNHGVLFPIVPDTEYQGHHAIGEPRVPFLIIARREGRGKWVVADTKVGLIGTMESRTITYLEEDPLVETVQGDISSVEKFIAELKALLVSKPKTSKASKPCEPPDVSKRRLSRQNDAVKRQRPNFLTSRSFESSTSLEIDKKPVKSWPPCSRSCRRQCLVLSPQGRRRRSSSLKS
jgi:hypothetical protein